VERFDLVRVVRSCLTLERRLLQDRRITLRLETSIESAYLTGDPNSLFELVVNLVRNAADAYEGRPGTVDVDLSRENDRLRLRVTDHGSGIPPENLAMVFEPGFTTKEFGKGSGMGLALVRSVAQEVFRGSAHRLDAREHVHGEHRCHPNERPIPGSPSPRRPGVSSQSSSQTQALGVREPL
jgi:C4-dicarboxylate-specific signal transduction histidine kinase